MMSGKEISNPIIKKNRKKKPYHQEIQILRTLPSGTSVFNSEIKMFQIHLEKIRHLWKVPLKENHQVGISG